MKKSLPEVFSIIVIAVVFIASLFFYAHFPAIVPTHWDIHGNVNGYSSRVIGAFLLPIIVLVIYILLSFIPRIDPRRDRYPEFIKTYSILKLVIVLFISAVYILTSISVFALGYKIHMEKIMPCMVGILFIVIGNYLGKVKNNWFVGIRNPWTLSNEEVWNKTHRFSAKLFVLAGCLCVVSIFLPSVIGISTIIASVIIIVLFSTIYSYREYIKLK